MKLFTQMGRALLGATSVLVLTTAARAADPVLPDMPMESGFNWSGFYIGVGGGFGADVHELSSPIVPGGVSLNGIGGEGLFGEVTLGYDYMVSPRLLVGGLVDAHFGNIETSLDIPAASLDAAISETYGFDAGLRLGYLLTPTTLGYVVGGYSWQKFELDIDGADLDFDWDSDGYFVGVGMETVITGNWTLKGEYRYTSFGSENILADFDVPDGFLDTDTSRHTFHIGANYRFGGQNGGGAAFEAPAYNWTGFFVGGALGAGAVVHEVNSNLAPGGIEFNGLGGEGVFGEINVGYDHEFGSMWVAGIQAEARYSGITSELEFGGGEISVDADYGFDVLARVGAKVNESTLAYVIGGYSWQHFDLEADFGGGSNSILDWNSNGFSVGGGLETAVTNNMTVGVEYRYSQFDDEDFSSEFSAPAGALEIEPSFHTVRIGAKYKFN